MSAVQPPAVAIAPRQGRRRRPTRRRAAGIVLTGYWKKAPFAAVFLLGLIVARLSDLWAPLRVLRPVILSVVVLGALFVTQTRPRALRSALTDRTMVLMALYSGWAIAMVPFALYRGVALQNIIVFPIGYVLMASVLLTAPTMQNLHRITVGFLGCVTFMATVVLARGTHMDAGNDRLTTGAMYDPNDLAALLALCFPIGASLAMRPGRARTRALGAFAALVCAVGIAKTGSRGGVIALAVAAVVLVGGMNARRLMFGVIGLLLCGSLLWSFGPATFRERTASLFALDEDYNTTSTTGRRQIWRRGIGYWAEHPITGVGVMNFAVAEGQTFSDTGFRGIWLTAHNTYLQAFAELGTPGGILLLLMLWHATRATWRMWRPGTARRNRLFHRPEYLAGLLAFCSAAFFLSHAYNYLMFGLLGLMAFVARVATVTAQGPPVIVPGRASAADGSRPRPRR